MRGTVRKNAAAAIATRPAPDEFIDEHDRRYQARDELGRGVLTAVYAAEGRTPLKAGDPPEHTPFAIKTILPLWLGHPLAEARIAREREVSASLHGPEASRDGAGGGLCARIVAGGRQPCDRGTRPFHVSPRLSGVTLSERLRTRSDQDSPAFLSDALSWADDLLVGLARVHAAGWVHRDVKPQNVFLGCLPGSPARSQAWLIDFGLAVPIGSPRSDGDEAFGTPAYVSPEVIASAPVDPRADLYSVGLILFELFAGQRPFASRDPVALLDAHLSENAPKLRSVRPARSETLERVISATLGKDPGERPPSAEALRALLRDVPEAQIARIG